MHSARAAGWVVLVAGLSGCGRVSYVGIDAGIDAAASVLDAFGPPDGGMDASTDALAPDAPLADAGMDAAQSPDAGMDGGPDAAVAPDAAVVPDAAVAPDAVLVVPDAWAPDAWAPDAWAPDAWAPDAWAPDAWAPDAWAPDAWAPDAWAPDAWAAPDATFDGGSDAGPIRTPIVVAPGVLSAPDWTHRALIRTMTEACTTAVSYPATGGAPGDYVQIALTGCPMNGTGRDLFDALEWNNQDLLESRDGRICRINVRVDATRTSSLSPTTCATAMIGVMGTRIGGGIVLYWTQTYTHCPSLTATFPWTTGAGALSRAELESASFDFTQRMTFVLLFRTNEWGVDAPDMTLGYDGPRWNVVFDRDADGLCDDVDPTP